MAHAPGRGTARWHTTARHKVMEEHISIITSCHHHTPLLSTHRRGRWWGHGGPLRERVCPSVRRVVECSDSAAKEEVSKKERKKERKKEKNCTSSVAGGPWWALKGEGCVRWQEGS